MGGPFDGEDISAACVTVVKPDVPGVDVGLGVWTCRRAAYRGQDTGTVP